MARNYTYTCFGRDLQFTGPEGQELYKALGNPNAGDEAVMQLYAYHDRGPELRFRVAEKLEALTGEARQFKMEKSKRSDDERKVFTESEAAFINRLVAKELTSEGDVNKVIFDTNLELGDWAPSVGGRSSKPNAKCYEAADAVLSAVEGGKSSAAEFQAKWTAKNNQPWPGETFDRDSVAKAWQINEARKEAERKAAAASGDLD